MSEEPGEARDSAEPDETVVESPDGGSDDNVETEFHPFDEVDEDFQPGPMTRVMGGDGLPVTVDQTAESDIPALSTTSLVCMADVSKFVRRNDDWGETVVEFTPAEVQRAPNGRYRVTRDVARARYKERDQEIIVTTDWVAVEPIRPQCRHYVRQQGSFHLNAQHRKIYRLCAARRTTEGTFMTVSDLGMWACDMRDPYDAESAKHLDGFDNMKIEQGKKREHLPMFQSFGIFETPTKKED
jgi:hypothetical protein